MKSPIQVKGHKRRPPPQYDPEVHRTLIGENWDAFVANQFDRALRAEMAKILLEEKTRQARRKEFDAWIMRRAA